MNSKYDKAMSFMIEAHGEQRRWDGSPYWMHPYAVAMMVSANTTDDVLITAALLHDVLEDTDITYTDIYKTFGSLTADLVRILSRKDIETYDEYIGRIGNDSDASLIKIMDLVHNLSSLDKNENRMRYEKYQLSLMYLKAVSEKRNG